MTDPLPGRDAEREAVLAAQAAASYGVGSARSVEDGPSPHRPVVVRKQRGPVVPALLILVCLLGFVVLRDPALAGDRLRELVKGQQRISPMVAVPQGAGHHAFTDRQADGSPVSYNPCRRIHYEINPDGAPDGYEGVVRRAVAEVSQASGFRFAYDGTTQRRGFDGTDGSVIATNPVLVMWATPAEVPRLADEVIGLGGSAYVERHHRLVYVTGGVALDSGEFADLAEAGDEAEQQAIVMHELGHVLGLAHVHDAGELMNQANIGRVTFGRGDLQGLALLGRVPCV